MYISLGPNPHPAAHLKQLEIDISNSPFNWLHTPFQIGIKYVNDNINNDFSLFLKDLSVNDKNKIISKNYPKTEIIERESIKNLSFFKQYENKIKKFLDVISNQDNEITFIYNYSYNLYKDENKFNEFCRSLEELENNKKIRAKYNILVYVLNKEDFKLVDYKNKLNKTVFLKYIFDNNSLSNFKDLLNKELQFNKLRKNNQIPKEKSKLQKPNILPKNNIIPKNNILPKQREKSISNNNQPSINNQPSNNNKLSNNNQPSINNKLSNNNQPSTQKNNDKPSNEEITRFLLQLIKKTNPDKKNVPKKILDALPKNILSQF